MSWEPIRVDELRIGHFIRLDHSWFQHPFLRGTFEISSLSEIEIIRRDGLTRIRVDPGRSKVAASVAYDRPAAMPEQMRRDPQFINSVSAEHQALIDAKQLRMSEARATQRALAELSLEREEALIDCTECLRLLQAGRGEGFELANSLATRYGESVARTTQFGLVQWDEGAVAHDPESAVALDMALVASSAARVLGLERSEQQLLISAALLLAVNQLGPVSGPAAAAQPEPSPTARSNARNVDAVRRRVALLRETGERSPRLLRLVEQHRERLDGSGGPKGLTAADIDPLSLILAACSEYRRLATGPGAVSPSRALARLYLQEQKTLGLPAIEAVVAALTVYPPGTCVDLSDGTAGLVIRSDSTEKLRPTVMLLPDEGSDDEGHEIVDLQAQRSVSVRRVLDAAEVDRSRLQRIAPGSSWSAAPWPQAEPSAAGAAA